MTFKKKSALAGINMTDNSMNGNLKSRCLLAPHLWPEYPPDYRGTEKNPEPVFYLSWPGWELYLRRRLSLTMPEAGPTPLLLPDLTNPEQDFAAIDQLVRSAGELGAGLLNLSRDLPESLPALTGAITHYSQTENTAKTGPLLDDRSYLALWTVNEYQARRSQALLAEAAARERAMWAALKGEEENFSAPIAESDPLPEEEADPRTAYAWRCWRRLAEPLLMPSDIILPTAPAAE